MGRWDRIDKVSGKVSIIDYKSSAVKKQEDANKRALDSVQLSLYSLAYREVFGELPDYKELRFLETGLTGRADVTQKSIEKVIGATKKASDGIRTGNFSATPKPLDCEYCAYNQICPFVYRKKAR